MRMCRKPKSELPRKARETAPKRTAVKVEECANAIPEQNQKSRKPVSRVCKPGRPTKSDAEFFKQHGCSVCADKKDCDMTSCKYEKEMMT